MNTFLQKLQLIKEFITTLSFKRNVHLTVFITIILSTIAIYENRTSLYENIGYFFTKEDKLITKISTNSQEYVTDIVNKVDYIVAIQITVVNFEKNTRIILYTSVNNSNLKKVYEDYSTKNSHELPLFTSDEYNNNRIIDLINGNFNCYPFVNSIGYKLIPDAVQYIHSMCATGIPPFYGKFSGIVTIYTNRELTAEELDQTRTISKNISSYVFQNDFR